MTFSDYFKDRKTYKEFNEMLDCDRAAWYANRKPFVEKFAWAIPNKEAIDKIVSYSPIIEVGSGLGFWASLISRAGGNIVAYDNYTWYDDSPHFLVWNTNEYPIDWEQYREHTLFLCWPHEKNWFASATLEQYKGNFLIYVGEDAGGCTGDDEFFKTLDNEWDGVECIDIPQWDGIHDYMYIYYRRDML